MRIAMASVFVLGACVAGAGALGCSSSGGATPEGACTASNPECVGAIDGGREATSASDGGAGGDAGGDAADASCMFTVDDAGITHGCGRGSMGPGDRDDGGDAAPPPPPDAALDATDLPLGASCWDNAQCASGMCFDYAVRGTFCTKPCSSNADCPTPPFSGCNGMGVCRMGN